MLLLAAARAAGCAMPRVGARNEEAEVLADPEVQLALTGRSGPLVVEIEYRVAQDNARAFHNVMQDVQLSRQRNGAYGWSIARDIADPELWTERYHCPTWLDYLRQRNRSTQSERALHQQAIAFHIGPDPVRIRRMLERPFGSVRWKEDTPDRAASRSAAGGRKRRGQQHVEPSFGECITLVIRRPAALDPEGQSTGLSADEWIPGSPRVCPGMTMERVARAHEMTKETYCPCSVRTFSQALDSRARFCFRQASTT